MLSLALLGSASTKLLDFCGGEYSLCDDGSCALTSGQCGVCPAGEYACPLSSTCLSSLEEYATSCGGLEGASLRDIALLSNALGSLPAWH